MLYGYTRVSSHSQATDGTSLANQKKILIGKGVKPGNITVEVGSATKHLPLKEALLQKLEKGDVLMTTKLDRFSRNTLIALTDIKSVGDRGATFVALDLPNSEDPAMRKMFTGIAALFAEHETERRKERQLEGIALARKDPAKYLGRKSTITPEAVKSYLKFSSGKYEGERLTTKMIMSETGLKKTSYYKMVRIIKAGRIEEYLSDQRKPMHERTVKVR